MGWNRLISSLAAFIVAMTWGGGIANAQNVALKSNLAYDALANVNAGIEIGLAPRWTFDISADYNGWTMSGDRKWKHFIMQPEARYWFCDRFAGHFIGLHLHGGIYNIGNIRSSISFLGTDFTPLTDSRFQGWFIGAGAGYGYAFILGRHWNLEIEAAVGYAYTVYGRYECAECGRKLESGVPYHYFGFTKAAINIVYLF